MKDSVLEDVYTFNKARYAQGNIVMRDLLKCCELSNISILDVGCNKGYWGKHFREQNTKARLIGVELDASAATEAGEYYDQVHCFDLNKFRCDLLDASSVDVALFLDVLEHLVDPGAILREMKGLLGETGVIYVSLPNVANIMIRLNLLFGRFDYKQNGILDRTHLHLYTRHSAVRLLEDNGYKVEKLFFSGNYTGYITSVAPCLGALLGYTIIVRAVPVNCC